MLYEDTEIEKGRKLFSGECRFIAAALNISAIPSEECYEIAGEVVGGDTNENIKNGMRVLVDPVFFCGKCFQCKIGNTNLCPFGGLMGRETNGGFAEYCVAKKNYIYPLPTGFDSKVGAAVQVLTTVLHAQNKGSIMEGDTVVILGLGVTGLMHIQLAKAKGAKLVIGVSRNQHKREVALSLGADLVVSHGDEANKKFQMLHKKSIH